MFSGFHIGDGFWCPPIGRQVKFWRWRQTSELWRRRTNVKTAFTSSPCPHFIQSGTNPAKNLVQILCNVANINITTWLRSWELSCLRKKIIPILSLDNLTSSTFALFRLTTTSSFPLADPLFQTCVLGSTVGSIFGRFETKSSPDRLLHPNQKRIRVECVTFANQNTYSEACALVDVLTVVVHLPIKHRCDRLGARLVLTAPQKELDTIQAPGSVASRENQSLRRISRSQG